MIALLAYLGWAAFWVVLVISLPAQVIGLPGTWIIVIDSLLLRLVGGVEAISTGAVVALGALAIGGEFLEFAVSAAGARSEAPVRGTVPAAIAGGVIGGVAGAPFLFGAGAIPGMALGAFGAVFTVNLLAGKGPCDAARSGFGALIGRLKGTAAKILIASVMVVVAVIAVLST